MTYAFPVSIRPPINKFITYYFFQKRILTLFMVLQHDELKPISKTFTDSLSELGNLKVVTSSPEIHC